MILVVDNYDSFTYNLVQYLGELGEEVVVKRNDEVSMKEASDENVEGIIISPGPGKPEDAGISNSVIKECGGKIPILGICLGHQCIAQVYGSDIVQSERIMHGKVCEINHYNDSLFDGMENPFEATRYHSLIVDKDSLVSPLVITADTVDGEIMGLRHKEKPLWGVQFHPESILTGEGKKLLMNFLKHKKGKGDL